MAFLLINPADTARKLFVLGDPLRVNGGSAGGGVAAEAVYAFLDLAGTADTIITPTLLNACMKGAVPGTWSYGASRQNDLVVTPTEYFHTFLRSQTEYELNPPFSCDGETFDVVTRVAEFDKDEAPDADDYEVLEWTPGEVISGDFMLDYRFDMNRTLGTHTGGTSVDVATMYYGGVYAAFQQKIDPNGTDIYMRCHGGAVIPIVNGVRYRVQQIANKTDQIEQAAVINDETGVFVGAGEFAFLAGPGDVLNFVYFGSYLDSGAGQGRDGAIAYKEGSSAVFSGFTVPAVESLTGTQTDVGTVRVQFTSAALSFLIERSDDGGAFATLNANYKQSRSSILTPITYDDATAVSGVEYEYRTTPKVGAIIGTATTSDPVVVNDVAFAAVERSFITSYTVGSNTTPATEVALQFTTGDLGVTITEIGLRGNSGVYSATTTVQVRKTSDASVVATRTINLQSTEAMLYTNVADITLDPNTQYDFFLNAFNFNGLATCTVTASNAVGGISFDGVPGFATRNMGAMDFKYTLVLP